MKTKSLIEAFSKKVYLMTCIGMIVFNLVVPCSAQNDLYSKIEEAKRIEKKADGERYFDLGNQAMQKKDYVNAIYFFDKSLEYISYGDNTYANRAYCKGELKDFTGAINDYSKAINLNPHKKHAWVYNNRAYTYYLLMDYNKGLQDAHTALSLEKNANYFGMRANIYGMLFMYQSAINDFNEAIKINPAAVYFYKRGLMQKANNDLLGATSDFNQALNLDPTQAYKKQDDPFVTFFTDSFFADKTRKSKLEQESLNAQSIINKYSHPKIKNAEVVVDIDGNVYQTVIVGYQTWMAENLRVSKFNDNTSMYSSIMADYDEIPYYGKTKWEKYQINRIRENKDKKNGYYYDWSLAKNPKTCPSGWRVPNATDWETLSNSLGGDAISGGFLKGKAGYYSSANNGSEFNLFKANATGIILDNGKKVDDDNYTYFWSSSYETTSSPLARRLDFKNNTFNKFTASENQGLCIRCVKGETSNRDRYDGYKSNIVLTPEQEKEIALDRLKETYIIGSQKPFPKKWDANLMTKPLKGFINGHYSKGINNCNISNSDGFKAEFKCTIYHHYKDGLITKSYSKEYGGSYDIVKIAHAVKPNSLYPTIDDNPVYEFTLQSGKETIIVKLDNKTKKASFRINIGPGIYDMSN